MAVKVGTNAANVLIGTAVADILLGLGGNDSLSGLAGIDLLDGGLGLDTMRGGLGNDVYIVSQSTDKVIELAAGQGIDLVRSAVSFTLGFAVDNLTLTGAANSNGIGNVLANTIIGNAGNNSLVGGLGNDRLSGLAGSDILNGGPGLDSMFGGLGSDTYLVDQSTDKANEAAGQGIDLVRATATFTLGVNVENLTLLGGGNFNGTGNAQGNTINGNSGVNVLNGAGGNDVIVGNAGDDDMTGGLGADSFRFAPGSGRDEIFDFTDDVDTLFISSAFGFTLQEIIDNASSSGGDSAVDLSGVGADFPRIILHGFDNHFNLANDIVIF